MELLAGIGSPQDLRALSDEQIESLPKASGAERWAALKDGIWALLLPVIIIGGILSGLFTPTEAASIGTIATGFVVRPGPDCRRRPYSPTLRDAAGGRP